MASARKWHVWLTGHIFVINRKSLHVLLHKRIFVAMPHKGEHGNCCCLESDTWERKRERTWPEKEREERRERAREREREREREKRETEREKEREEREREKERERDRERQRERKRVTGTWLAIGKHRDFFRMKIQVFFSQHALSVLTFLLSTVEWPILAKTSQHAKNKLNFHFLKSLFYPIAHLSPRGVARTPQDVLLLLCPSMRMAKTSIFVKNMQIPSLKHVMQLGNHCSTRFRQAK